jgi:hypothetical protein
VRLQSTFEGVNHEKITRFTVFQPDWLVLLFKRLQPRLSVPSSHKRCGLQDFKLSWRGAIMKFRVSTTISDGEQDHQTFDHKIEAEEAAAELARGGFFSTLWEANVHQHQLVQWRYLCDFAPRAGQGSESVFPSC